MVRLLRGISGAIDWILKAFFFFLFVLPVCGVALYILVPSLIRDIAAFIANPITRSRARAAGAYNPPRWRGINSAGPMVDKSLGPFAVLSDWPRHSHEL
jgi:hypothetical protein